MEALVRKAGAKQETRTLDGKTIHHLLVPSLVDFSKLGTKPGNEGRARLNS